MLKLDTDQLQITSLRLQSCCWGYWFDSDLCTGKGL